MNQLISPKQLKLSPISREKKQAKINNGLESLAKQIAETEKKIHDLQNNPTVGSINSDEILALYDRLGQQSKVYEKLKKDRKDIEKKVIDHIPAAKPKLNIHTPEHLSSILSELLTTEFVANEINIILPELFPNDPQTAGDLSPNKLAEYKRMKKSWDKFNNQRTDQQRLQGMVSLYNLRIQDMFDQYFISTFNDFIYKRQINPQDINSEEESDLIDDYVVEFRLVLTGLLSRANPTVNIYQNSSSKDGYSPGKFAQFFGKNLEETTSKLINNLYGRSEKQLDRFKNMGVDQKTTLNATLLKLAHENRDHITEKQSESQDRRWSRYSTEVRAGMIDQALAGFEKVEMQIQDSDEAKNNEVETVERIEPSEIFLVKRFRSDTGAFRRSEYIGNILVFQPKATVISSSMALFRTPLIDTDRKNNKMQSLREIQKKYSTNPDSVSKSERREMQSYKTGITIEDNFWKYTTPVLFKNVKNCIAAFKTQSFSLADRNGSDIIYILNREDGDEISAIKASKEFFTLLTDKKYSPYLYLLFEMCFGEESMETLEIISLNKGDVQFNTNIDGNIGFLPGLKLPNDQDEIFNQIKKIINDFDEHCILKSVDIKAGQYSLGNIINGNRVLYEDIIYPVFKDQGMEINSTTELLKKALQD
jgi:hypothetical protein